MKHFPFDNVTVTPVTSVVVMPIPTISGEITAIPISSKLVIFVLPLSRHTVFYEYSNSNRVGLLLQQDFVRIWGHRRNQPYLRHIYST
ncbi:MAG TPA: hypothetical protein VI037_04210 [Nitrososphaera sp.]